MWVYERIPAAKQEIKDIINICSYCAVIWIEFNRNQNCLITIIQLNACIHSLLVCLTWVKLNLEHFWSLFDGGLPIEHVYIIKHTNSSRMRMMLYISCELKHAHFMVVHILLGGI